MEKIYLLGNLSFVHNREGNGATSPSCASRNIAIDALSSLVEAQMASYFIRLVCEFRQFPYGKELLACESFVCSWRRGQWRNAALLCK